MRDAQRIIGSLRNRLKRKMNLSDLDDRQVALDNLLDTVNATDEHVLAKDTATGKAVFKAPSEKAGGSVPEYINIQGSALAEGDQGIMGPVQWDTSKMIVKEIRIWTTSTDWDLWLIQNDQGLVADDATVPAIQLMGSGNGDETIFVDRPYEDEDDKNTINLNFTDNVGSATFSVSVVGTELA